MARGISPCSTNRALSEITPPRSPSTPSHPALPCPTHPDAFLETTDFASTMLPPTSIDAPSLPPIALMTARMGVWLVQNTQAWNNGGSFTTISAISGGSKGCALLASNGRCVKYWPIGPTATGCPRLVLRSQGRARVRCCEIHALLISLLLCSCRVP